MLAPIYKTLQTVQTPFAEWKKPVQGNPVSQLPSAMKIPPLFCLFLALTPWASFAEAPNIILLLTDDQGWSEMSATMDPKVPEAQSDYLETPNMARLMEGGMRFTSGYSPAPLCTPTRRAIQCGASAARSGTEFKSAWIPADHLTIPKALKSANASYKCAHFGKWGEQMISTPEECGYDVSDGMTGNNTGGMPGTLGVKGGHDKGPDHFVDNEDPKRTKSLTKSAIGFMKDQSTAGNPFYMQVSYYAVHLSVVASEQTIIKYVEKGKPDRGYTQAWAAMLEELDTGVGQLLDAIDELGIGDNTYVFFTADNGGRGTVPGGDQSLLATNFPLTGSKHTLYEGGVRVPFIARGPGIQAGSVNRSPAVGSDFLPTFFELAGGKDLPSDEVDGISLASYLGGEEDLAARPLFFHRPGKLCSAVRHGAHKLYVEWNRNGTVREKSLYKVAEDPREEGHEVTDAEDISAQLEEALMAHLTAVDAETALDYFDKKSKAKKKK